jgi:hypothetical protein
VYTNPANVYQDAQTRGRSLNGNFDLVRRYIEVMVELPPTAAAAGLGWRDPWRIDAYVHQVFVKTVRGGLETIEVRSNGTNFVVIITRLDEVTQIEAQKVAGK